jgi:hypothetical protein
MAEGLEISRDSLRRWQKRQESSSESGLRPGRPQAVPEVARQRIRRCYVEHFGEWGPRILADWCRREALGDWCPQTIAGVIADLRERHEVPRKSWRYEVTRSGVMWSEDGAGFRERGRKKELLVAQDEHSRFKVGFRLSAGPAKEHEVVSYLEAAFREHGAPLVLKHDGGSIFHSRRMRELLAKWQVLELTGPSYWPQYNGKTERSIRDIKSYERAMRRAGIRGRLAHRLEVTIRDLNYERPRPVLGGRTSQEAYDEGRGKLPSREALREEVRQTTRELRAGARSRREHQAARRRALELVLLRYDLMRESGDVSHDSSPKTRTY